MRMDSGQDVQFNIREHPHLEYGYAATSHSSQGATADRVLVQVDTEQAREQLINTRLAYGSVSRGRGKTHKIMGEESRAYKKGAKNGSIFPSEKADIHQKIKGLALVGRGVRFVVLPSASKDR